MIDILENQIRNQIEGVTEYVLKTSDCREGEILTIIKQGRKIWLKPYFCSPHRLSYKKYQQVVGMIIDNRQFNTDLQEIQTKLSYNQFMNIYYN